MTQEKLPSEQASPEADRAAPEASAEVPQARVPEKPAEKDAGTGTVPSPSSGAPGGRPRTRRTQIAEVRAALDKGKRKRVRRLLRRMHSAKVAGLLESLSGPQQLEIWELVHPAHESRILAHLSEEMRDNLRQESDPEGEGSGSADSASGTTQLTCLRAALDRGKLKRVGRILNAAHPAKVAGLLESLPPRERSLAWEMVDAERGGKVLAHLHQEARLGLIEETDTEDLVVSIQAMEMDDLVELMRGLSKDRQREVVQAMDRQARDQLDSLLAYPEDSAGGLMNTDQIEVRAEVTVRTVLRYLRLLEDLPEHTDKLMVVDRKHAYQGVLLLRHLVTAPPQRQVAELMIPDFEAIPARLSKPETARRFEEQDLISAPVVDETGQLIGRITIDDMVDVIREQSDHSLMSMAGLDEEDDMFAPIITSARRRALWLGINLITAFLAAWVIGLFEGTLQQVVALAVLMPIVASMGGIAGSQTLTLVIRGLALGQVESANARLLLVKELGIGLLNGILWALVVAALAVVWFGSWMIGAIIATAILLNLLCAALSGVAIPLILKRLNIDPALAGSVVLTTVTDVVGFFAFLGLGTLLLI